MCNFVRKREADNIGMFLQMLGGVRSRLRILGNI